MYGTISLKLKMEKIMDYKILAKALKFAFLPTLSVFVCIWFAVLSVTDVFQFLLSDSGWAIAMRIFLLVVEVAIIAYMYFYYLEEEKIKEGLRSEDGWQERGTNKSQIYEVTRWEYSNEKIKIKKIDSETVIIKKNG